MKMKIILKLLAVCLLCPSLSMADPVSEADIQQSFYPYKSGFPSAAGYEAGVVINKDNVERYKALLNDHMYRSVSAGWVELKTAPTTDFPLSEKYVQATRDNAGGVSLNDDGTIEGYISGRAFPVALDSNDPLAGSKLVWNYQYGFNAGDSETIFPFWWEYRNMKTGKIERTLKFKWHFLNFTHRVDFEPVPRFKKNPGNIYRGIYSIVREPYDLANTQLLIHRYEDNAKRDDAWLYLGFQRRVRRLATGTITDAFLGSDLMIEDFEGYNGRIIDYNWEYGGTQDMLLPFYNHNEMPLASEPAKDPDGFRFIDVHGEGGCFPNITYQLRKTHTLIGTPKNPSHPIGRRVINIDAQTAVVPYYATYDRKGDLWKAAITGKSHSDHHLPVNKGKGVAIDDFAVVMDVQANHCTTLAFKSMINAEDNPQKLFTVQNMRKAGS